MRKQIAAAMLLLILLCGCGTTAPRPTVGAPATGPVPTDPVTMAPETITSAPTTATPPRAEPSEAPETTAEAPGCGEYVLNTSSKRFHLPSCGSVKNMKPENTEYFTGSRDELEEMGYAPCGNCEP